MMFFLLAKRVERRYGFLIGTAEEVFSMADHCSYSHM